MAITHVALTSGVSSSNVASYQTATISPTANRLVLLAVLNTDTGTAPAPTVTGCGLTWEEVDSINFSTTSTELYRLAVYRARGASPTTGEIDFDFASNVQTSIAWSVVEFAGMDATGTHGSGAIVQANAVAEDSDADGELAITLSAFGASDNRPYAVFAATRNSASTWTFPGTWDEIDEVNTGSPNTNLAIGWRDDGQDTTITGTLATTGLNVAGIAIEIKAAASGGAGVTVSVPAGSLSLTGYAPTAAATANQTVAVPSGGLSLTGYAPAVVTADAITIEVPAAALSITGYAPAVSVGDAVTIAVPVGALSLAGYAPTVLAPRTVAAPAGSLTLTGFAPAVISTRAIAVPAGGLTLTGYAPTVSAGGAVLVSTPLAALLLTGFAPTVVARVGSVIRIRDYVRAESRRVVTAVESRRVAERMAA